MKKRFALLFLVVFSVLIFGCESSKVENPKSENVVEQNVNQNEKQKVEENSEQNDEQQSEPNIFLFEFGDEKYIGVEGMPKTFAFRADTTQLSHGFIRNSVIFILNNTDTYQVNFTSIKSVEGLSNSDSKHEMLEKYYTWEKDFQENNGIAIFQADKKISVEYKESEYLGWTYILNKEKIEPNNFITTRGWTVLSGDYFVTIMESIAEEQNKEIKNAEYNELYKRLFIFDDDTINGDSVNKVVNDEYVPLDFSINGGKTLDSYWDKYFETENTKYIDLILNYLESDDKLLDNLNFNYSIISKDDTIKSILLNDLGLKDDGNLFTYTMDLETVSCFNLKNSNSKIKDSVKYIYSLFPNEMLVRGVIKSSAMWSLLSNAEQRPQIYNYLLLKKPELKLKTQTLLDLYL